VKNLALNIGIRVLIIVCLAIAFAFVTLSMKMFFAPVLCGLMLLLASFELVRYISKSGKQLTRMLLSVKQGAYTDMFANTGATSQIEVSKALNEVIREFGKVTMEKELHYQYLNAVNEHIQVAILSFDEDDKLIMMNPEAKRLFRQAAINRIDDLRTVSEQLAEAIKGATTGRKVVQVAIDEQPVDLSVQSKDLVVAGKRVRIVLLHNISSEMQIREVEAWESLTKELTHEIMNSVTPIASLADAVRSMITRPDGTAKDLASIDPDSAQDLHTSIETIAHRSKGLLRFVSSYKEFSKKPEMRPETINIPTVIKSVVDLLGPAFEKNSIHLNVRFSRTSITMTADQGMIEQVLINILKNAIEAAPADGTGAIDIYAMQPDDNSVTISVSDNGPGMDQDTLSRIFIPFFTTKSNGTGIGLSLSRKIMNQHHGTIRAQSAPGEGTIFTIEWHNRP